MRKLSLLLVFLLLISIIPGCSSEGKKYQLLQENGQYYIEVKNVRIIYSFRSVDCSSVKELKDKIINGSFTQEELEGMAAFDPYYGRRKKICNLDDLWEPVWPDGVSECSLSWYGKGYSFKAVFKEETEGDYPCRARFQRISTSAEQSFQDYMANQIPLEAEEFPEWKEDMRVQVHSYLDPEITYKPYRRWITYSLTEGSTTYYICEMFFGESSANFDSAPETVRLWIESGELYGEVELTGIKECPTIEFLTQFGIKQYTE